MKITNITAAERKLLKDEMMAALQPIADKYGLSLTHGVGRYMPDGSSFTSAFELAVKGEDGRGETTIVSDFRMHAPLWGLKATDIGRRFVVGGTLYDIVGAKASNRKYPILGQRVVGKTVYKFMPHQVVNGLVAVMAA